MLLHLIGPERHYLTSVEIRIALVELSQTAPESDCLVAGMREEGRPYQRPHAARGLRHLHPLLVVDDGVGQSERGVVEGGVIAAVQTAAAQSREMLLELPLETFCLASWTGKL